MSSSCPPFFFTVTFNALACTGSSWNSSFDPAALFAPPQAVREEVRKVIDAFGVAPGHVFNLGHGILQKTPIDAVAALVDEVRAYSAVQKQRNAGSP